jgi:spore coat protein CotH
MSRPRSRALLAGLAALAASAVLTAPAQAQTWPDVFDPYQLATLDLELNPQDWDTIRFDTTNEIEVPAAFGASGEEPILVSVRRKSSRALPSEADPRKIGLKIDINEFVDGQEWHGLVKLSLENGADVDPIAEGLAWNMHELAGVDGFYGADYHPALASWAKVYVNGEYLGVYVNVEQRDRRMLENRRLFFRGQTWLYEIDDRNGYALEVGDPDSPTYTQLCYPPFRTTLACKTPSDSVLATQLPELIDMQAMLTQGGVDSITGNQDALFSHGKNYFFADFSNGLKRRYYPWDLDAVFRGSDVNIYGWQKGKRLEQTPFQSVILNHPLFRSQYNAILLGLTDPASGPLSETAVHGFLDAVEPVVSDALAADPYAGIADVDELFAGLQTRASALINSVRAQAAANTPPPRG